MTADLNPCEHAANIDNRSECNKSKKYYPHHWHLFFIHPSLSWEWSLPVFTRQSCPYHSEAKAEWAFFYLLSSDARTYVQNVACWNQRTWINWRENVGCVSRSAINLPRGYIWLQFSHIEGYVDRDIETLRTLVFLQNFIRTIKFKILSGL
jgi:hypothetical protein